MAISKQMNASAGEQRNDGIPLAMDDSQVAALVAAGREDLAQCISLELSLANAGVGSQMDELDRKWNEDFNKTCYDGVFDFVRFAFKAAVGQLGRDDENLKESYNKYKRLTDRIVEQRQSVDPDYNPDIPGLERYVEKPEERLEYLRMEADAILKPQVKPSQPLPGHAI